MNTPFKPLVPSLPTGHAPVSASLTRTFEVGCSCEGRPHRFATNPLNPNGMVSQSPRVARSATLGQIHPTKSTATRLWPGAEHRTHRRAATALRLKAVLGPVPGVAPARNPGLCAGTPLAFSSKMGTVIFIPRGAPRRGRGIAKSISETPKGMEWQRTFPGRTAGNAKFQVEYSAGVPHPEPDGRWRRTLRASAGDARNLKSFGNHGFSLAPFLALQRRAPYAPGYSALRGAMPSSARIAVANFQHWRKLAPGSFAHWRSVSACAASPFASSCAAR